MEGLVPRPRMIIKERFIREDECNQFGNSSAPDVHKELHSVEFDDQYGNRYLQSTPSGFRQDYQKAPKFLKNVTGKEAFSLIDEIYGHHNPRKYRQAPDVHKKATFGEFDNQIGNLYKPDYLTGYRQAPVNLVCQYKRHNPDRYHLAYHKSTGVTFGESDVQYGNRYMTHDPTEYRRRYHKSPEVQRKASFGELDRSREITIID